MATTLSADNTANALVSVANTQAATTTVTSFTTVGGNLNFSQSGGGALQFTGPVTSGNGSTNGGSITVNATNGITIAGTANVSSASGSGGSLIVTGAVTLIGPVTGGQGTITLNGGGGSNADIVITGNITIAGPLSLTAQRDILIRAVLTTTGANTNSLSLVAGTGASGANAGGVWVDNNSPFTGQVVSAGTLTITGKDLFATPTPTTDAIRLDGTVSAAGTILLDNTTTGGAAPAGAGTWLNTTVQTSAGNILVNNPVTLTGSATVTNTASAGNVTFASTIDGGFGLTVNDSGTTTFTGAVGATTPLASLTTDAPGTTQINGGSVKTSGNQTYNDAVTLGTTTTLTATGGSINQGTTGTISGGSLITSSATGTNLGNANTISTFNATNTVSGNVTLVNAAAPLTVTGITATGGSIAVNNTGNLNTSGTVQDTTAGTAINLTATTGTLTIGAA